MTFQPNANFLAANDAAVKRLVFAVNINGSAEWFHDYEITGATANHYKRLVMQSLSGVPADFNPIQGDASIGGFSFEVLNPNNEIFTWWNLDELYKKTVIVKAGYADIDWSDYEEISTAYIQKISINESQTGFVFECQDLQNQVDNNIFTDATDASHVTISARNPIDFWLQIMTSTGTGSNGAYDVLPAAEGLAINSKSIDIVEIELLRDDFLNGWMSEWEFAKSVNALDFFQTEIYAAYALTPIIKASGAMSLRPFMPPLYGYMASNDMGTILDDEDMLAYPAWETNFDDIVNKIEYHYDYDIDADTYNSTATFNDSDSQTKFGVKSITIESKGITTNILLNYKSILPIIVKRYFRKFAILQQIITAPTKIKKRIVEPGDQLLISSNRIPNITDGNFTWGNLVAETWSVQPDFTKGTIDLEFRDINLENKKYGVISPVGTPDYTSATDAEKIKYCWVDNSYYIL